jgi:methionyl-tRNA formyltransferase
VTLRTVFVGAVEGSLVGLEALARAGLPPALVVSLPPERAARHSDFADLTATARAMDAAVLHAADVNAPEILAAIGAVDPDLCLVIGWSQICREPFRRIGRLGAIGFHPAPLPRMRGRAVIPWTLLLGETETGSTLFWLDEDVDAGDIVLQERFEVDPETTARMLYDAHLAALGRMLPEAVRLVGEGRAPRQPQDHDAATWCARRRPEDGRIDWSAPAAETLRLIRAVGEPYPGAFTNYGDDRIVIDSARLAPGSERYVGLAGQVQAICGGTFTVRAGDGSCVEALAWRSTSGRPPKLHTRLGEVRA